MTKEKAALAISLDQFKQALVTAKENTKETALTTPSQGNVDVEYFAFGNTTTGKQNRVRLNKKSEFEWHNHAEDKEKEFIPPNKIIGLRGFVLKAKDGYVLYASDEDKEGKQGKTPPPVCSTTSANYMDYKFNNKRPSYAPLTRWQDNSSNIDYLTEIGLMGSRGETCAQCILNKNNVNGTVQGRANGCQPSTGLLFSITEIGIKTSKNAAGIEWRSVTTLKNEDDEFLYDSPVIINIETTKSTNGSGNKDNSLYEVNAGKITVLTAGNGGPKYIPDDSLMFYPYWQSLINQQLVQEAPKGTSFPEHPQLPYIITARTEVFLAPPEVTLAYATTCPVYRTVDNAIENEEALQQLCESLNTYVEKYDGYVTANNVQDTSYELKPKDTEVPVLNGSKMSSSDTTDNGDDDFSPNVFSGS